MTREKRISAVRPWGVGGGKAPRRWGGDDIKTRVMVYAAKEGCVSVKDVAARYGLSRGDAQQLLEELVQEGRLARRAVGVLIYCHPDRKLVPQRFRADARKFYTGPIECLKIEKFREALLKVINAHRGHQAAIRPRHIVAHMDEPCRLTNSPALYQIAAYFLLQYRAAILDRKKYLFDLDKLKTLVGTQ
jgi:hypothetical protein